MTAENVEVWSVLTSTSFPRIAEVDESIAATEPSWILNDFSTMCTKRSETATYLQSCNVDISPFFFFKKNGSKGSIRDSPRGAAI